MIAVAAAFWLLVALAAPVRAEPLVVDLSSHIVPITTGFAGAELLLFGATDGEGDVAVVVRGPAREVLVRRKARVLGIWLNVAQARYRQVPGYYYVAASRALDSFAPASLRERHAIGVEALKLESSSSSATPEFRAALVRVKQEEGLFPVEIGKVSFLGDRLFRTRVIFPANVPTGTYLVDTFLVREGQIVGAQATPLVVSKVGLGAEIFELAHRAALPYGLVAVVLAAMAGWLVGLVFRRS